MHRRTQVRRIGLATIGLLTLVVGFLFAPLASAQKQKVPAPVKKAGEATVTLLNGKQRSVAFAVGEGLFLTTEQAASRGALQIEFPGGKSQPAQRVESDAPAGLALVKVTGSAEVAPVSFADGEASLGTRVWILAPKGAAFPGRVKAAPKDLSSEGLLYLSHSKRGGLMGAPVVDAQGRVVAVVRANRPSNFDETQAVVADRAPSALPPVPPQVRNDFPAVGVTLGLAVILLVAALVLRPLRRRALTEVETRLVSRTPEPEAAPAASPTPTAPEDEIEVILKR
jgi:hypothetical protein